MTTRRSKAEQAATTTSRLIATARTLFTRQGFARTATEEIVVMAEVTRGALYHHFTDKRALFEAVFLELQAETGARIAAAAAPHDDTWDRIIAGCRAFLAAACAPDFAQIVLRDGPAVLGAEAWRRADEAHSLFQLRQSLQALNDAGVALDVEATLQLLNGALNEAAMWIADASDRDAALARADAAFRRLVDGLRASPAGPPSSPLAPPLSPAS